jgi:sulfate permease, SulP family
MTGNGPWAIFRQRFWGSMLPSGAQEIGHDFVAALALAAIAIPEQMATARLAGLPAIAGLLVFVAGSFGFFLLGSNRSLSVGADSTIAPIFAGSLGLLAVSGSPHYLALAAALALMVGVIVAAGGAFRLGWIARLLSVPIITGFLAGIAIHIAVSQLPAFLGIENASSDFLDTVSNLARNFAHLNPATLTIGIAVFAITFFCEKIDIRLPGALVAIVLASVAVRWFGLASQHVAILGAIPASTATIALPIITFADLGKLLPIAVIVSLVVMIQTAATSRSFQGDPDAIDVNRDLIGVGFGNILSGIFGGFPANSSPPRTAIVAESGGKSRLAGLCAAAIVLTFLAFGMGLLTFVPVAALSGLLLFVAQRILRFSTIKAVATQSRAEFALLLVTAAAIVVTPIEMGVAIGIALSLLHGVWTITQTRAVLFERLPGSTVWWPASPHFAGETFDGIAVVGFQAPLFFLNAETFRRTVDDAVRSAPQPVHAIILEASSIVEVDFSGAQILTALIRSWRDRGVDFYISRLESVRALQAMEAFGVVALLGQHRIFHSVDDALKQIRSI